jgi:hypothetical protein
MVSPILWCLFVYTGLTYASPEAYRQFGNPKEPNLRTAFLERQANVAIREASKRTALASNHSRGEAMMGNGVACAMTISKMVSGTCFLISPFLYPTAKSRAQIGPSHLFRRWCRGNRCEIRKRTKGGMRRDV